MDVLRSNTTVNIIVDLNFPKRKNGPVILNTIQDNYLSFKIHKKLKCSDINYYKVQVVHNILLSMSWFHIIFNPFASEPPLTTRADPRPFYRLRHHQYCFNGQGQLCPLTSANWRDLSNHTRMSTIQSRTPEKKAKNHVTWTWKFPWKSCSTTHLPFLSSNPKILKAFLKTFPTKVKPTKCPAREKKMTEEKQKKREG